MAQPGARGGPARRARAGERSPTGGHGPRDLPHLLHRPPPPSMGGCGGGEVAGPPLSAQGAASFWKRQRIMKGGTLSQAEKDGATVRARSRGPQGACPIMTVRHSCHSRDSSVGRASDRRSEGLQLDPGSRHTPFPCARGVAASHKPSPHACGPGSTRGAHPPSPVRPLVTSPPWNLGRGARDGCWARAHAPAGWGLGPVT